MRLERLGDVGISLEGFGKVGEVGRDQVILERLGEAGEVLVGIGEEL